MVRKPNDILNDLEHTLTDLKQTTLGGPDFKSVDVLCEEWLKERGYSVHPPFKYAAKSTHLDDLFNLFYSLFRKHYPDLVVPYNGTAHDRKIAKDFVNSRMEASGMDKKAAMSQCAEIIEATFRFKDRLDFDKAPSFGIFTPSMGWLVGKVIDLMNKDNEKAAQKRLERKIEEQTKLIENEYVHDDLEKIFRRNNV